MRCPRRSRRPRVVVTDVTLRFIRGLCIELQRTKVAKGKRNEKPT